MNKKYDLNGITKLLNKVFNAGFVDEKSILAIQLEDLEKIPDISSTDISIIIELKKAIKNKRIIAFLSCKDEKKEGKINEQRI